MPEPIAIGAGSARNLYWPLAARTGIDRVVRPVRTRTAGRITRLALDSLPDFAGRFNTAGTRHLFAARGFRLRVCRNCRDRQQRRNGLPPIVEPGEKTY